MRKRNVCGFVVLLMAVMSVAGALAWGNRPRAARKAKTPKVATPRIAPPPNRRTTLPSRSTSSRIKRQTVLGVIDVVPGVDGNNANGVGVNPITNRVYTANDVSNNVSVIDAATNLVIGSVPVGAQPRRLAVNANTDKIYVANRSDNTVSVIDGSTNTVTATISVGTNPTGVDINPNTNKIYVANQNSNDVSVIDGATNTELTRIQVDVFPTGVGVNPNTNRIYVSNYVSNTVSVIDGATNTTDTVPLGLGVDPRGVGVNPNTNRIYVATRGSVFVIDGITRNVVNTIAVGAFPVEIAVNAVTNTVYVTNRDSNDLSVIDGATDTVTTTVPMGVFTQGVAVDTVRNRVYVANTLSNTVNVVDGATNVVTDTIPIGSHPMGIATNPNLNRLYVPNGDASDTVSVIDGATNQVIGSVGTGRHPTEVAVNTATSRLYVINAGDNTLSVIDGATNKTIKTVTVPSGADSVAVNSNTNRVYLTSASLNRVVVFNGADDSLIATIPVAGSPKGIAVNSNTNRLYTANEIANSVSVIDGVSNTVLTNVPVGNGPSHVDVDPYTNTIYVTNITDQTLSVIDGATNTVTATIPLGFSPQDVAVNPATRKVYVPDGIGRTLIIDGATNIIVAAVTTADEPLTVAVNSVTGLVYLGNTNRGTVTVLHDPLSTHSVTVFNTNDNGPGSLRQAIMDANDHPGTTIVFRIPRSDPGFDSTDGVFIIRPTSPLPPITSVGTVIDGATQTQFTGDTNPEGPEIVINGGSAGASAIGLVINDAANCVLNGLVINGFSLSGISINGANASGNLIMNCYIGTNARGDSAVPNLREGVVISAGANGNRIGGTIEGGGNLISGNDGNGVEIRGTGSDGNRIGSNYIGTDRSGNAAVPNGGSGIVIDSSNNVVGGASSALNLISGNNMSGVEIVSGSNNVVQGNFIGTDVNGTFALGNGDVGVELLGSATNNLIGGTSAAPRNLISGNNDFGVALSGMSVSGNRVMGNIIGADVSGTAAIGNRKGGVLIDRGMNNVVGGAAGEGNLISGNSGNGVEIAEVEASGNVVQGNAIGTNVNGTVGVGNMGSGVYISDAPNNFIGGVGNAGNVISGNERNGVVIEGSAATGNAVQGNSIGGNKDGSAAIGNNQSGVVIRDAPGNVIGGAAPADGNVISGNGTFGVLITFAGATGNQLQHNLIGADKNGTADLGNALDGVNVNDAPNTVIQRNLISGNDGNGITLVGAGATGTAVRGNGIGVNLNGDAALGNTENGIVLDNGASGNTIGNPIDADMNVISGNGQNGILLNGATTTNNTVAGNFIGTDKNGASALGNVGSGVRVANASNNLIGGLTMGARNVISGNGVSGVEITGSSATGNQVQGNFIGTDKDGISRLSNENGVAIISANNNVIGGISPGAGNVISGNDGHGVTISGASANNTLQGNLIGTDKNGASALGNVGSGVRVANASNNLIGGINPGEGNVISDNEGNGVHILGTGTGNRAQGNVIGMDVNGAVALGNDYNGVLIDESSQNVIGGAAVNEGNRIAHNALDGVRVTGDSATQNRLQANRIHDNGGLGINLVGGSENAFGVTANDPNDADGSPNKLQNFPVLTLAETDGNSTTVSGSLDSAPTNAAYPVVIQFFVSSAADPSGFGEGKALLASHTLNTPGNFFVNNLPPVPVGAMLTATATDDNGNTSEFSQAMSVSAARTGVAHLSIGATPSVVEIDGQAAIEVRATDNLGNAVPDTNINFQTTGGTLSANADTTDANGRAKVLLSHIPFGTTTVTAEADSVSVTVEVKGVLRIGVPAGINLLSFPVDVTAGQVGAVFRGGRVDVAQWVPSPLTRLGHYEFFSQQPFDLNAGQGYWVRSDVAQTVEITNGTLPDPQQPARITFERDTPGWDLRGNPSVRDLLFDITRIKVLENGVPLGTLADIARDDKDGEPMVEPYCWKWTNDAVGAGYELVIDPRLLAVLAIPPDIGRAIADNHLEWGRGAFFFLRRPNLALEFPPELLVMHAARAHRTKREPVKPSMDNWTLRLQAQAGDLHTGDSVIGVSEKIENDLLVKKSPPVTSQQFVDLSLLNEKNETLAWDVRAARAPQMTWDVLVTTNQTGTVSLIYPHLSRLPKNLRAYLVDPDSGKRQFLRTTTQYTFTADPSGITQKRLRLEVTSETDSTLRMNGLQATVVGSDAARLVRLSFILNREAMVRGRVLSPTGKMIRAMTPMAAPRGLNVVSWDGKTQRGGVAGRGVYVIELVAEDGEGEQVRAVRLVTLR